METHTTDEEKGKGGLILQWRDHPKTNPLTSLPFNLQQWGKPFISAELNQLWLRVIDGDCWLGKRERGLFGEKCGVVGCGGGGGLYGNCTLLCGWMI